MGYSGSGTISVCLFYFLTFVESQSPRSADLVLQRKAPNLKPNTLSLRSTLVTPQNKVRMFFIQTHTNHNALSSSISRLYYRGANACILCYSITDPSSFEEMGVWLTELRRNLPADIILHVVGTKADIVARDPSQRHVPFERCIAYVADNLAPGMSSTPPATATPGGVLDQAGSGSAYRSFMGHGYGGGSAGGGGIFGVDGARSPSSKRSSGFWGQEVGWDCCHEVSAESGEGVEEVFRVITRKLVEQNRKIQESVLSATNTPGMTPGIEGMGNDGGYFDGMMGRPGGSFRVGRDRRSWFGVPVENYVEEGEGAAGEVQGQVKTRRKCC